MAVKLTKTDGAGNLQTLRVAQAEVHEAVVDEKALARSGRSLYGISGRRERLGLAAVVDASGDGWRTATSIVFLAFADALVAAGMIFVTPAMHLSLSPGALGPFVALRPLLFGLGGVIGLRLVRGGLSRSRLARSAAITIAVGMGSISVSSSTLAIFLLAAVTAAASGSLSAVLLPVLFDAYRPEIRARLVGAFVCAVVAGIGSAEVTIKVFEGVGYTWRVPVLIIGVAPLVAAAFSLGIKDNPVGARDGRRIGRLVTEHLGGSTQQITDLGVNDVGLTTIQMFQRAMSFKARAAVLQCAFVFGFFAWGFAPALSVFLRDRWGLVGQSREMTFAAVCLAAIPGILWFASKAEIAFRETPGHLVQLSGAAALLGAFALTVSVVSPGLWLTVILIGVAISCAGALLVAGTFLLLTVSNPEYRGHAAVLMGLIVLGGAITGPQLIGTFGSRFGIEWAMVVVAVVPLGASTILGRSIKTVEQDVDAVIGHLIESNELATRVSLGHHLPLISCRNINFAYGQVQVLFDVCLTVDDGEMVALLGTNGAGKSTLLRLVSGLSLPSSGSIHYRGADITFLGSDRRVELGISQIPGGRGAFGNLSVIENLRAYGYTLGKDRRRLDAGIDDAFSALPVLGERRSQLASTLSGGERQMLALAKTYLLKPRLLLIDELSLGLAPKIVAELLDMVRQVNAAGTAIVLVEQSVNVALSVVDHAYFMEKGEMRFDGVASELLNRPDLLRSVFLQGATEGLRSATS